MLHDGFINKIIHSFIEDYDGDGQLEFRFSGLEEFAPLFERVSAAGDRMPAENFSIDQGEPGTLKGILYTKSTDLDGDGTKDIILFRWHLGTGRTVKLTPGADGTVTVAWPDARLTLTASADVDVTRDKAPDATLAHRAKRAASGWTERGPRPLA